MSLIKCQECGKQISEKAKACPNCGYVPRRTSALTWLVVILLVIGTLNYADHFNSLPKETPLINETPEQAEERKKKNEAIQKEIAEKKIKDEEIIKKASIGAITIKKVMRDPESFKLESALVIDETEAVCYSYRAKNGFGGVNVGQAVLSSDGKKFKTSEEDGFVKLWNKECAKKTGREVVEKVKWFNI